MVEIIPIKDGRQSRHTASKVEDKVTSPVPTRLLTKQELQDGVERQLLHQVSFLNDKLKRYPDESDSTLNVVRTVIEQQLKNNQDESQINNGRSALEKLQEIRNAVDDLTTHKGKLSDVSDTTLQLIPKLGKISKDVVKHMHAAGIALCAEAQLTSGILSPGSEGYKEAERQMGDDKSDFFRSHIVLPGGEFIGRDCYNFHDRAILNLANFSPHVPGHWEEEMASRGLQPEKPEPVAPALKPRNWVQRVLFGPDKQGNSQER